MSLCAENDFKIWRLNNKDKRITMLHTFRMIKKIQNILLINSDEEYERTDLFKAYPPHQKVKHSTDRFFVIFKPGTTDAFEFRGNDDHLYFLNVQSSKEHDESLTGFDWLKSLKLIVTSDKTGCIRIWSDQKKFIREIKFPANHPIDSVCFLNA